MAFGTEMLFCDWRFIVKEVEVFLEFDLVDHSVSHRSKASHSLFDLNPATLPVAKNLFEINRKDRNSHPEVFYEKGVLKNFAEFIGKHPWRSLFFHKVSWGLQLCWKRLRHRCFPVNSAKFLRVPYFIEHLWWPLLKN